MEEMDEGMSLEDHIAKHVEYPIKGRAIKEACDNMGHLSEEDKEKINHLDDEKEYGSVEEVKKDLG